MGSHAKGGAGGQKRGRRSSAGKSRTQFALELPGPEKYCTVNNLGVPMTVSRETLVEWTQQEV